MGVVLLSHYSGSKQVWRASRFLAISWLFTLQFWLLFEGDSLTLAYLALDSVLVWVFYKMSNGYWFPVPLFFLHAILVVFHFYSLVIDQSSFWMTVFVNRGFEMALAYTGICAAYRISRRATDS